MARTFRRPRSLQPIAELNVTNMIDLGFTLLIIFMITTPLIQQEQTIAVNLPSESARAIAKPPPGTTYQPISIDARGQYYFGQNRVSFAELENHVAELATRRPHPRRPGAAIPAGRPADEPAHAAQPDQGHLRHPDRAVNPVFATDHTDEHGFVPDLSS